MSANNQRKPSWNESPDKLFSLSKLSTIIVCITSVLISTSTPIQAKPKSKYLKLCMDAAHQNQLHNYKQGLIIAKKAIAVNPKIAEAHYQLGLANMKLGRFKQALYEFTKSIKIQPGHQVSYVRRAHTFFSIGNVNQGLDDIEVAAKLNPADIKIINDAQRKIRRRGLNWYRARFQKAMNPKNNYLSRGLDLEVNSKYKEAVKVYSSGIKPSTTNSCAYEYRGNAYKGLNQYSMAIKDFTKAISLNPTHRRFYLGRASIYELAKQDEKALRDYSMAVYLDPISIVAPRAKGLFLEKKKRFNEAIKEYSTVVAHHPALADAYVRRGDCYAQTKQYKLALKDYLKTLQLDMSESKSIYERIANTYDKLGKHDKAKRYRMK